MKKTVVGVVAYLVLALAFPFLLLYIIIERFLPQPDFGNYYPSNESDNLSLEPENLKSIRSKDNINISLDLGRWMSAFDVIRADFPTNSGSDKF